MLMVLSSVRVRAASVYEAASKGLNRLNRVGWESDASHIQSVLVEVSEEPTCHRVNVAKLLDWLKSFGKPPYNKTRQMRGCPTLSNRALFPSCFSLFDRIVSYITAAMVIAHEESRLPKLASPRPETIRGASAAICRDCRKHDHANRRLANGERIPALCDCFKQRPGGRNDGEEKRLADKAELERASTENTHSFSQSRASETQSEDEPPKGPVN